ncbi:MAG: LPS assembly protein LptD, partial [Pseudomonadota bacterium]|nr:LPS assembly protein LptD [Pseudomonadota bacterium]
ALLTTEVRYLTQQAGGQLEFEYMPHDKAFGDERASLAYVHRGPLSEHWYTDININYASDERYFEELGNNISVASVTHLERRGDLLYIGNGWNLLTRVQEFQTLTTNPNAKPYERMPQLLFKTQLPERNQALNFDLQTEFVRFDRDSEVIGNPIGQRVDMYTLFSYPWKTPATFVIPKLSLRYTLYELEQRATGENSNPDRFLYTFSTDSGLFLERSIKNEQFIQTLEPRLFYRYTPYDDQSELPVFDTALYDLSFWQLFRPNRYSGPDRIDDGHQVTLALTSRFLDAQTGIERLRASLGQIYYFRDRRVTLPYQEPETESSSPIIVELASQLTEHWSSAATWRWDPHQQNTEHTVLRTRYHPSQNNIVNFSYRLRDNILEQTDLSTHWSLGARWNVLARWNYSLPQERTLETFTGLEYSSCCWAIRGIVRRYLNNIDGFSYLNGFFLQFELKGLGGIGKKADSFLEQRIPGYHDQF